MTQSTCVAPYPTTITLANPATGARSNVENNCIGIGMDLNGLREYWANIGGDHSCNEMFNQLIYGQPGNRQYSSAGFEQAMDDFDYLFSAYFNKDGSTFGGHTIASPGQPGYDVFQQTLIDACTNPQYQNQGVCMLGALKMCQSCDRNQVIDNPAVLRLCGCHVPQLDPNVYPGVGRECDPLCNQPLIAKDRDVDTGVVAACNTSVCVINNVSIQAAQSTVGGVNFTQVCPQCTGTDTETGGCRCIADVTLLDDLQTVGIGTSTSFNQACGSNSICLSVNNSTGVSTQVPCQDALQPAAAKTYNFPVPVWVWFLAGFILIIGILVILSAIYASDRAIPIKPMPYTGNGSPTVAADGTPLTSVNFRAGK